MGKKIQNGKNCVSWTKLTKEHDGYLNGITRYGKNCSNGFKPSFTFTFKQNQPIRIIISSYFMNLK